MEPTMETATEPATIETIAQSLTPRQKARLHEVADLLLEIYHTLARMRYLDPDWIQPGPHDLREHMPLYHSLHLDPAIIYLYHILPYLDPVVRDRLDFFDRGRFIDYREKDHIEEGRDPAFVGEPAQLLRPWMTPLSMMGNHTDVLIYDAKRHVIGMFGNDYGGSGDRNLHGGMIFKTSDAEGRERYVRCWDGVEVECGPEGAEEWERQANRLAEDDDDEGEEEEEEDEGYKSRADDEDDDGDEEEEVNDWDEMEARRAPEVLRDIIRWYHELVEIPGNGENDQGMWDEEIVKPLYHKHGWPGQDFDGEGFLVDKVRAEAAMEARSAAERPFRELDSLRCQFERDEQDELSTLAKLQEKLGAAKTVDEEWYVKTRPAHRLNPTPSL
jgi:hypothetical protein